MPHSRFYDRKGPFSARELAEAVGAELYQGELGRRMFVDVAPLSHAQNDQISFLDNTRYTQQFSESGAGACIVRARNIPQAPQGMVLLIAENPYVAYAQIAAMFYPEPSAEVGIHPTAVIHPSATIGKGCAIEPYAVIEAGVEVGEGSSVGAGTVLRRGVSIGKNCRIAANCHVAYTMMGDRVIVHPNVAIGQDGFGFATERGHHVKVPQLGKVMIGNDVEIGAGTCIDRGAAPDTIIGDDVKIDNLVQIGHNVRLGKGCIIVAQVGISGSTHLGDFVVVGGQTGIAGHLTIASGTRIAAQSGVMRSVEKAMDIGGAPAMPSREWHRQTLAIKNLAKSDFMNHNNDE